jgi:membrane protein YqaA with SNARE-associated domain
MMGESALRLAAPVGLILVLGFASGLVPVLNAEALLVAAVLQARGGWPAVVVAIAVGQSTAKVLIFLGAREGRSLLPSWLAHRPPRPAGSRRRLGTRLRDATRRWSPQAERVAELVRRPVAGSALILTSAVAGIPPLAATSVIAGAARMRLLVFGGCCLAGRLLRFGLIALPLAGWSPVGP